MHFQPVFCRFLPVRSRISTGGYWPVRSGLKKSDWFQLWSELVVSFFDSALEPGFRYRDTESIMGWSPASCVRNMKLKFWNLIVEEKLLETLVRGGFSVVELHYFLLLRSLVSGVGTMSA